MTHVTLTFTGELSLRVLEVPADTLLRTNSEGDFSNLCGRSCDNRVDLILATSLRRAASFARVLNSDNSNPCLVMPTSGNNHDIPRVMSR
jgi:hypothetical protein